MPEIIVDSDDKFIRELVDEAIEDDPAQFEKVTVLVDCDYASFLEFGTGPAKKGVKSPNHDKIINSLTFWAARHAGTTDPAAIRYIRGAMYHKIMEEGLQAAPFLRPAVWTIMDDNKEYHSAREIGEAIKRQAEQNLRNLGETESIRASEGGESSGILGSIKILGEGETFIESPDERKGKAVPPELWSRENQTKSNNSRPSRTTKATPSTAKRTEYLSKRKKR